VFYLFHGIYTKIFIIFESVHNLICKIKHKAKTAQKEKGKTTVQRAAWKSARRPAHGRSAQTRAARALASTHGVADSGPPLSASSSSSGRPNQRHDRAIRAIFAPHD